MNYYTVTVIAKPNTDKLHPIDVEEGPSELPRVYETSIQRQTLIEIVQYLVTQWEHAQTVSVFISDNEILRRTYGVWALDPSITEQLPTLLGLDKNLDRAITKKMTA